MKAQRILLTCTFGNNVTLVFIAFGPESQGKDMFSIWMHQPIGRDGDEQKQKTVSTSDNIVSSSVITDWEDEAADLQRKGGLAPR